MNKFYVYIHRRLSDNKPFYVGKGSDNRAWEFSGRNNYWKSVANKHGVIVEVVFDNLEEADAFQCEKDTITEFKYFGYALTNLTDGGEGPCGLQFTDEQRLRIGDSLRGRTPWNKGLKLPDTKVYQYSEEHREKFRQAKLGVFKGDKNPFADKNEYTFIRLSDGFEITCTRQYLVTHFGVDGGLIKKLFYKTNPRKSASGWKRKGTT